MIQHKLVAVNFNNIMSRLELALLFSTLIMTCKADGDQEDSPLPFVWLAVSIVVVSVSTTLVAITALMCYFCVLKARCTDKQPYGDNEENLDETMIIDVHPSSHLVFHPQWIQGQHEGSNEQYHNNPTQDMNERYSANSTEYGHEIYIYTIVRQNVLYM